MNDKQRLIKIKILANNALYFADNSDYESALWEILSLTDSKTSNEKLKYINESEGDLK